MYMFCWGFLLMKKLISSKLVYISLVFHKIETGRSLPVLMFEKCYIKVLFSNKVLRDTRKDG